MRSFRKPVHGVVLFAIVAALSACHRGRREPGAVATGTPERNAITSLSGLLSAMRERYAGNWYKSLSFTQVNKYTLGGKEQKSEWIENLSVPGRLRIDFVPTVQKNGLLIDNNRVTTFVNGRRVDSRRQIQPRPFLSSDIYVLAENVTVRRLDSLGVDILNFRRDRLSGKPVFVIGAAAGDMTSPQLWIDADRLLFLRFIQTEKRTGKPVTTELRVTGYREVGGFPVPEAFVTSRDGKISLREEYTNVKINPPMPAALFDPARWSLAVVQK